METLEALIAQLRERYKRDITANVRELATLESKVWDMHKQLHPRQTGEHNKRARVWFTEQFGERVTAHVEIRLALLSAYIWTEPLWKLLEEKKISINRAKVLMMDTKRRKVGTNKEYATLLKELIEEGAAEDLPERPPAWKRPSKRKPIQFDPESDVESSKEFRQQVEALTRKFLENKLSDVDDLGERDQLLEAFLLEIDTSYRTLLRGIRRVRRGPDDVLIRISRVKLVNACELLEVAPPAHGVFDFEKAKKNYRRLSMTYHPDRNGGSESNLDQYHAIQRAWGLIQEYYRR